jgi:lipoic acid synthetase
VSEKDGKGSAPGAPARLPPWIARRGPCGAAHPVKGLLRAHGLATVCEDARCPNGPECFARGTATFLILGDTCTRRCGFCAVGRGTPAPPDADEPRRVARAAADLGLSYVVITSVTRDDLADGGASHFALTIEAVRAALPAVPVEVLVPDFGGNPAALDAVLAGGPAVLNHNVETVPRLYAVVRPGAVYERSLGLLRRASAAGLPVKSGLMVGLGETPDEVAAVMDDLRGAGVTLLTIGQYLRPTRDSLPVARYVTPGEFDIFARLGYEKSFRHVASGPLVRSSWRAVEGYRAAGADQGHSGGHS